jgi:hypothetical protein
MHRADSHQLHARNSLRTIILGMHESVFACDALTSFPGFGPRRTTKCVPRPSAIHDYPGMYNHSRTSGEAPNGYSPVFIQDPGHLHPSTCGDLNTALPITHAFNPSRGQASGVDPARDVRTRPLPSAGLVARRPMTSPRPRLRILHGCIASSYLPISMYLSRIQREDTRANEQFYDVVVSTIRERPACHVGMPLSHMNGKRNAARRL